MKLLTKLNGNKKSALYNELVQLQISPPLNMPKESDQISEITALNGAMRQESDRYVAYQKFVIELRKEWE